MALIPYINLMCTYPQRQRWRKKYEELTLVLMLQQYISHSHLQHVTLQFIASLSSQGILITKPLTTASKCYCYVGHMSLTSSDHYTNFYLLNLVGMLKFQQTACDDKANDVILGLYHIFLKWACMHTNYYNQLLLFSSFVS